MSLRSRVVWVFSERALLKLTCAMVALYIFSSAFLLFNREELTHTSTSRLDFMKNSEIKRERAFMESLLSDSSLALNLSRIQNEVTNVAKKNLVFTSAGSRHRLKSWSSCLEGCNFDIYVVYYSEAAVPVQTAYSKTEITSRGKFPTLYDEYNANPTLFQQYEAVFVLDDDLDISGTAINQLFNFRHDYDLWVLQPCRSDSGVSHTHTRCYKPARKTGRYTNFVEVGAPLFRRDKLELFLKQYCGTCLPSVGLDWWYMFVLGFPETSFQKAAIVDSIPCKNPPNLHNKGTRNTEHWQNIKNDGWEAWNKIHDDYNLPSVYKARDFGIIPPVTVGKGRKGGKEKQRFTYNLSALIMFRIFPNSGDKAQFEFRELREWMEYMLYAGVEHFYMFDNYNDETEKQLSCLQPYIQAGLVTYVDWENIGGKRKYSTMQATAYNYFLSHFGKESLWLMTLDLDEYPHLYNDIDPGFLARFLDKHKLNHLVHFQNVGWHSYNVTKLDGEFLLERTHLRAKVHVEYPDRIKTICKPMRVKSIKVHTVHPVDKSALIVPATEGALEHFWMNRMVALGHPWESIIEITKSSDMMARIASKLRSSKNSPVIPWTEWPNTSQCIFYQW